MTRSTKHLVLLLMLFITSVTWAQQRPFADVAEIATTHLAGEKWQGHKVSATPIHRAPATGQVVRSSEIMSSVAGINANNEAFYVYLDGNSFVIVSGDERMAPVLAYSNSNPFDVNNIPSNVRGYLSRYVKAFKQLGAVEKSISKFQTKSGIRKAITGSVDPIVQTQWNQDAPFNNLSPNIPGHGKAATGCVATAMAQAMSVYKFPDCGAGTIDYTTDTYGIHLQDDLANYPLDWNSMLNDYNGSYTSAQGAAVANLMYACGLSVDMDYGPESGAFSGDVMFAGVYNFAYDADMFYANLDAMQIEDWHALVTSNLQKGYPIIYSGHNEYGEGHCFIIDGYDTNDTEPYYHVNWGWGGWCDGNYRMLHLSPESTGIGGGMGNFNKNNCAILGFKPYDTVTENAGFLQADEIALSSNTVQSGTTSLSASLIGLWNYGVRDFSGSICAYVVDGNGTRTQIGNVNVGDVGFYHGYNTLNLNLSLPSSLANGTYTIEFCVKPNGFAEQPLYSGSGNPLLYVGGEPEPFDPDLMVTDLGTTFSGERTVDMYASDLLNISDRTFTGKVKMAIADTYGNIIADFGSVLEVQSLPYLNGFINPQHFNGDIPSDLADGNYRLYLIAQQTGYTNWAKVTKFTLVDGSLQQFHLPCYTDVRIENGKIWINEDDLPEFYADLQTTSFTLIGSNEGTRDVSTSAEQICNFGNTPFTGQISLCVTDVQGSVISVFGTPFTLTSPLNHFSYLIDPQTISGQAPSDLPDGEYLLQLAAKQNGCRGWSVLRKYVLSDGYITNYNLANGIPFWISNGQMTFTEPAPTEVKVTNITLNTSSADLHVGETVQLSATVSPDNATDKTITWTSSNTDVATVSETGLVTAKALGSATITATAADGSGVTASCAITVSPVLATSIALNQTTISGNEGDVVQLVATVLPDNTTNKGVSWTSSNAAVASVSETGFVTINTIGDAVITATTVDGSNLSATCTVTGSAILVGGITLNTSSADLHVGETVQLSATVSPDNATDKTITWTSSNTEVVTVSDAGLVTAIALGSATITATAADGSGVTASCAIVVSPVLVGGITLNTTSAELLVGEIVQLSATVSPDNATDKTITWTSSNTEVATVSDAGLVTAIALGNATITATAADGSGVTATCAIVVSPIYAKDIVLNQNTFSGHEGEQVQLVATVLPDDTTNKGVSWTSSNAAVASVSETGLVTINAIGDAVITATTVDGSNLSATCDVLGIGVLVDYVGLNVTSATLHVGETLQLEAMILPEDATIKDVIWTSNNTDVATVSEDGLVTAIALGTVDIMATAADGSRVAASCAIIVSPILVESIELNYDETEIHLGETLQLEATVLPENAENKTVSWESYSPSIASVDENGLVTAMNEGTTTIVAKAHDGSDVSGCCYLTVLEVDGILNIIVNDTENIDIYSPDGKRLEKQRTGVNIIRNTDGTVRKVFKK